jgi:hypothetical protein
MIFHHLALGQKQLKTSKNINIAKKYFIKLLSLKTIYPLE